MLNNQIFAFFFLSVESCRHSFLPFDSTQHMSLANSVYPVTPSLNGQILLVAMNPLSGGAACETPLHLLINIIQLWSHLSFQRALNLCYTLLASPFFADMRETLNHCEVKQQCSSLWGVTVTRGRVTEGGITGFTSQSCCSNKEPDGVSARFP